MTEVGVPLIVPVVASMDRPVGSPGFTVQDTTAPPPVDGVTGVINSPFVRVSVLGE